MITRAGLLGDAVVLQKWLYAWLALLPAARQAVRRLVALQSGAMVSLSDSGLKITSSG